MRRMTAVQLRMAGLMRAIASRSHQTESFDIRNLAHIRLRNQFAVQELANC
jgi:hypothetical protein